jgi:cytochrome c553
MHCRLLTLALFTLSATAARANDADPAARPALDVLKKYCYRCHGQDGSNEGQMNFILDPKALVEHKLIVPGDAAKSKLYKKAAEGEMPPEGETPRPSADDLAKIKEWINALRAEKPTR